MQITHANIAARQRYFNPEPCAPGASRHFAATQQFNRFQSEADIQAVAYRIYEYVPLASRASVAEAIKADSVIAPSGSTGARPSDDTRWSRKASCGAPRGIFRSASELRSDLHIALRDTARGLHGTDGSDRTGRRG
jgi:hypothetical protein